MSPLSPFMLISASSTIIQRCSVMWPGHYQHLCWSQRCRYIIQSCPTTVQVDNTIHVEVCLRMLRHLCTTCPSFSLTWVNPVSRSFSPIATSKVSKPFHYSELTHSLSSPSPLVSCQASKPFHYSKSSPVLLSCSLIANGHVSSWIDLWGFLLWGLRDF